MTERRLTTILAIDVVGYSRLMAADESGTLTRLMAIRSDVIEPLAGKHRGRIVKLIGDGILMEFGSVVDAVGFAVDLQRKMAARGTDEPESARIRFRIGINIGDVIVDGDDIYGDGVNVAARAESLAEPGGICVTRAVFDHAKGKVACGFAGMGSRKMKNIPEPVQVYRVLTDASSPDRTAPAAPARKRRRIAAAAALALLAAAAAAFLWPDLRRPREEPASMDRMAYPLPDRPSIAVLPFNDLSEAGDQEYFADGMTEDLITDLSKIAGLFVIARNSSFAYKGAPVKIRDVAEELGVRFVLEGSVRRAGDTLRVNTQLIDATTGGHVWADRFDGTVTDIFAVQDQFVLMIVNALELELSDSERTEIEKSDTREVAAMEAFQRGWELYSRFNEQDNAQAVEHFKKAIELDPEYGRAYGALALVYLRGSIFHWDRAIGISRATLYRELVPAYLSEAAKRDTALVHVVTAMRHLFYRDQATPEGTNRGTDDARREAGLAIALQPSDPEAHVMMAWALIAAGDAREGLSFVKAAMRLNPNYPSHYDFFLAAAHYALGDLAEAATVLRRGLERDPRATELRPLAASVYAQLDEREEARDTMLEWLAHSGEADLETAVAAYDFPIRWVNEHQRLNTRLLDGLNLATLPLEVIVPELVAQLDGGDVSEQVTTMRRLGWFGPAAAAAVPRLIDALGADSRRVQREAAIVLGKIGPGAAEAVPTLAALADQPIIGFHARNALEQITSD